MMRAALAIAALSAFVSGASAADDACYGPLTLNTKPFAAPELFVVAPGAPQKLHFLKGGSDQPGCPAAGEQCAEKAFVTPGDLVVVAGGEAGHACATFTAGAPRMATTSGFLPRAALAPAPAEPSPDWAGDWRSGEERRIALSAEGAAFAIKGEASYGAGDPERVSRGAVNLGSIDAKASPRGGELAFAMGDDGETLPIDAARKSEADFCRVRMWRLGPYLVVADNASCGGANVTFTGVYRKG